MAFMGHPLRIMKTHICAVTNMTYLASGHAGLLGNILGLIRDSRQEASSHV